MAGPESTVPRAKSSVTVEGLAGGIEGTVSFDAKYLYRVTVIDDFLRIWLQNVQTERQWQSVSLVQGDFVNDDTLIPQAKFQDYAMCFVKCLDASIPSDDFARELIPHKHCLDAWELRLTVKIRAFVAVWSPTYSFTLQPIHLSTVEIIEAKIREQDDKIHNLANDVQELFDEVGTTPLPVPVYLRALLLDRFVAGQTLVWKREGFVMNVNKPEIQVRSNGTIKIAVPGIYVVSAMIQHNNTSANSTAIELRLNNYTVVSVHDSNANGHYHTTSIHHVFTAAVHDELCFVYQGSNHVERGSRLVVHQLR